jgi:co-chaperonin GroES (HSP10)
MAVPTCIENNILVKLDKSFQDEIVTDSGIKFFTDTTFNPEWNVSISGVVVSVPHKLTEGNGGVHSLIPERPNISQIVKAGDEIIFSYTVVMNRNEEHNKGDVFERNKPISPFVTEWENPYGLKIIREYLMNDKYRIALIDTKTMIIADMVEGNKHDVESFMGRYMPDKSTVFNYNNLLNIDDEDYWMVDYANVIAIKDEYGYRMVGDYVLLEPIREPISGEYQGLLEVYEIAQDADFRAIGKVISIGEPLKGHKKLSVKPQDTVVTDIRFVEKYKIDGKDYWVARQKYIYGKTVVNEHI